METTIELGYTTYNLGMLAFAVALLVASAALVVGGIIGYRRSRQTVERAFAMVATGGGTAILMTVWLAGRSCPKRRFGLLCFWNWVY